LIPRNLRKKDRNEDFAVSSPKTVPQIYIPTPIKASFHPHTIVSPSSSSTSQSTSSTPPFTAHTPITTVITVVLGVSFFPTVPLIPINMANRYAPLQLPANLGAMP